MADFVDETVREIDSRLAELQEEVTRLEAARTALVGIRRGPGRPRASTPAGSSSTASPRSSSRASGTKTSGSGASARPSPSTPRRRGPGRPRGRRGGNTRSNQALNLVKERPGITIPQIAEQLKIEPNYLYRVMPKLVADGQVKREGQGWHPVANGAKADSK